MRRPLYVSIALVLLLCASKAFAAVALVQQGCNSGTLTASVTLTGTTAGNTLVAIIGSQIGGTHGTVSDGTNTYNFQATCPSVGYAQPQDLTIYNADNIAGGNVTVAGVVGWGGNHTALCVSEWSGLNNPSIDVRGGCGQSIAAGTHTLSTGTITTTLADDLIIGANLGYGSGSAVTQTLSCGPTSCTGTPNTLTGMTVTAGSDNFNLLFPAYAISSGAGLWQQTNTETVGGGNVSSGIMIALKAADAPAPPTPTPTPAPTLIPTPTVTTVPAAGFEPVPAMGWDSWRVYGVNATEAEVKANALAMTTNGMQAAGYQYVEPNDNWSTLARDGSNNIIANATRYPNGMAALGTYIHGLGLKYGLYAAPGTLGCNGFIGSLGFEPTDATQFAGFGIDRLMYDSCTTFQPQDPLTQLQYQAMGQALRAMGRSIQFFVSDPTTEYTVGYPTWASMTGATEAISCPDQQTVTWTILQNQIDLQFGLDIYVKPGLFNWCDYLGVGNGTLTDTEGITNFSMDAEFAEPLFASIDLTAPPSAATLATLTNSEVIAIDQDVAGLAGKRVHRAACGDANCEVYAKQLANGWAVVLFNRASTAQSIAATWSMFSQTGPFVGRDVWVHNNVGLLTTGYTATVPSHGVAMIQLSNPNSGGGGNATILGSHGIF